MRIKRIVLSGAGVIGCVAAGVASATVVITEDRPADPGQLQRERGSETLAATAKDPNGRAPWVARVYRTETGGLTCVEAVQRKEGRSGLETRRGYAAAPTLVSGVCADRARQPATLGLQVDADALVGDGGRTSIVGVVPAEVRSVRVSGLGQSRELVPGQHGAFIAVFAGEHRMSDFDVAFELNDGRVIQALAYIR